ncbi:NAD(P)H-hydrate dehydratase [Marinococcus halophilus]|uniref:NAD(P)H-hydrate dehydratase n=1 Tax=Marinococcus halophilus TaxID=1371 RepID=UPI0015C4E5A3|nr:NAD(P)H-hydrate dehydratase [Marinococcus halophilus]
MQIVTSKEMQQLDQYTIETIGMKEELLMENAGRAAADEIHKMHSEAHTAVIFAGKGNNGGDGFVIGRNLSSLGWNVSVYLLAAEDALSGGALYHKNLYCACGLPMTAGTGIPEPDSPEEGVIYIDAMLGTGIHGELKEPFYSTARWLNSIKAPVTAVDIPTGVPANEEELPETAVMADTTVVLEAPTLSTYLYPARHYYGEIRTVSIGVPRISWETLNQKRQTWEADDAAKSLPERTQESHKGDNGKGLLIAGAYNMPGAPAIASNACLRSGIGLLTTSVPESALTAVASHVLEATYFPLAETKNGQVADLQHTPFPWASMDGVAAGSGLGRTDSTKVLTRRLLTETQIPLVLDADGLYFLPELEEEMTNRESPLILTPHPGEMGRLTGLSPKEINAERFTVSRNYAREFGCYVVLKGPNTIITTPEGRQYVSTSGSSALAKGGSGDALTGIVLAMMLQAPTVEQGVCNAVYIHGLAAEMATAEGVSDYSFTASNLIDYLPKAIAFIQSQKK